MQRLVRILAAAMMLLSLTAPALTVRAEAEPQGSSAAGSARVLLAALSPEERVGQLFLVTFKGRDVSPGSQIYNLITQQHIGGVVLLSANDNFSGPENTIPQAMQLVSDLQRAGWDAIQATPVPSEIASARSTYIPLFTAISQEGDGVPYDQILNGMSPLPNEMALGATWNSDLAKSAGELLGKELKGIGFNMLLGPSLDVLDTIHSDSSEDLGARSFGGDPYWVGVMGKAYIDGLHSGSQNKVAVVSKHFPGRGSSDRSPDEEVATVRKSLEQMKQIELAPFFAVTGLAGSPAETTDGVLVSHIRYQGFQGNIRATTKPVSFDSSALEQLLALPELASWRSGGGVVVSDDLGSKAVQTFFDPTGQAFDARQVARTAFLAGNDLLYVGNFQATGDEDAYTTITRTVEYFTQKYVEDPAFAQRVDQSVERLLTLKFKLYPEFSLDGVLPDAVALTWLGTTQSLSFEVARSAAAILSPAAVELDSILPRPPEPNERMVFLTDTVPGRQCSTCVEQSVLSVDSLQNAVLRLYGPQAGGQVYSYRMSSYSYSDLTVMLSDPPAQAALETDLRMADWIVVAMHSITPGEPESQALRRFLSERPDLVRNKRVVVFGFNAPYYLDATDISKISAYYALYSKEPAFIELAARLLFQETAAVSAAPVSVPGIGYDLITATSPDPAQVIPLNLDLPEPELPAETAKATLEPTSAPVFLAGDSLPLKAGPILDHNHHPVPDGTPVRFLITTGGDGSGTQQIDTFSLNGYATASYRIPPAVRVDVRVVSEPAMVSQSLTLDITGGVGAMVTAIVPTPVATQTVAASPTPMPTLTPTPEPTPQPNAGKPDFGDWVIGMAVIWGIGGGLFYLGKLKISTRWGVRWALFGGVGGLVAYTYLALGLPGGRAWVDNLGTLGVILAVFLGVLIGFAGGVIWRRRQQQRASGDFLANGKH